MFTKVFCTLLAAQVHYIALGQNDVYRIPYDYVAHLKNKHDYLRDYDFMGAAYNEEKKKDFADGSDDKKISQPLFIEEKKHLPVKDIHYTITEPFLFDERTGTLIKNGDHRETDMLLDEGKKDIFVKNVDENKPIFTDLNDLLRIYKPIEIVESTDMYSVKQNKRNRISNKNNNSVNKRYLGSNPDEQQLIEREVLYVPKSGRHIDLNSVRNDRRKLMSLLRNRNIIVNIHHLNAILRKNIKETNDGVVNKNGIELGGKNLKTLNKKAIFDYTNLYREHTPRSSLQGDFNAMYTVPGETGFQTVQSYLRNPEHRFEREEYLNQHDYKFNNYEEGRHGIRNQQKHPSYYSYFVENQNRDMYAPYRDDAKDNNFVTYSQYYAYPQRNQKRKKYRQVNYISYPRRGYKIKNARKYYEIKGYAPINNVRNKYGIEKYESIPINRYRQQNYVKHHYLPRYHERNKSERRKYESHATSEFRNENSKYYIINPNFENIKRRRYFHLDADIHDDELNPYLTRYRRKHKYMNIIRQFEPFSNNLQGTDNGMERYATHSDNEVKENNEMGLDTSQFSEFLKNIMGISKEKNLMILVPDTRSDFGGVLNRFLTYYDYENEEEEEEKEEREN